MNLGLSNQTTIVGACLTVANSTDYKSVWTGNPPADFGTDIVQLKTNYDAVMAKAALADANQLHLSWSSTPGASFVVETSTNLMNWVPASTVTAGDVFYGEVTIIVSDPQEFFRVRKL